MPRHTVIVLNHSGERKKIFSTDFFLVGAHVHCLDETDLNTGSIGLDYGSLNVMELHLSVNQSTAWKMSDSTIRSPRNRLPPR